MDKKQTNDKYNLYKYNSRFLKIINGFLTVGTMFAFVGFYIVFINANIVYFQDLPDLISLGLPIGIIAGMIRIAKMRFV